MKRLISTFTLLLLILSSCDSPVNNVDTDTRQSTKTKIGDIPTVVLANIAPAKRDSMRKEVVLRFKAKEGSKWKVSWNKNKATPLAVFAGTTQPIHGSPEKGARAFLAQNRSLFNMHKGLGDLKMKEVQTSSKGLLHVRFQQTYHNIPVYEAGYQVHIRSDGRIDMANGHYYQNIEASTSPSISSVSAKRSALNDLGAHIKATENIKTTLMVYKKPKKDTFTLAWRVIVPADDSAPGTWQYFVGASDGQILSKLNLATFITGTGDVIEKTPNLTPTPITKNFSRLDGSGYLRGTFANVHNKVSSRAYSSVNNFQYSLSNTHFDEANVYWHLDDYRQNFLNIIGFAGRDMGSDQDIEAYVHDQNEPNNAHYDPDREAVIYGENLARYDVVINHEFSHAAADVENGSHYLDPNYSEEGAIGEGQADYFAGSYVNRSENLNRDMANPSVTSYTQYESEEPVEPHRGGEFFSAILWDLRNASGISHLVANEIIFEAIGRLSGSPNFIEFRDAMMAADDNFNGGVHSTLIQDTFANRGVGNPVPPPSPTVTISGPANLFEGQTGIYTANVSGGQPPYQYQWSSSPASTTSSSNTYQYTPQEQGTKIINLHVVDSQGGTQDVQRTVTVIGTAGPSLN